MSSLLTPLQETFLHAFFATPVGQQFFLTGGTALAAFYLRHRLSDDLDLFTLNDLALEATARPVEAIAEDIGYTVQRTRVSQHYQQVFLMDPGHATALRIDLCATLVPSSGNGALAMASSSIRWTTLLPTR